MKNIVPENNEKSSNAFFSSIISKSKEVTKDDSSRVQIGSHNTPSRVEKPPKPAPRAINHKINGATNQKLEGHCGFLQPEGL